MKISVFTVVFGVVIAGFAAYGLLMILVRPSNERDWEPDQAILPTAELDGSRVTIRNIRNFTYRSENDYTPSWYDKTFDLRDLDRAWFVVEPFGNWKGAAHTFVTFGFDNRDFVSISIEIRKQKGESFSALEGLFRQYEIMYVIGDEMDLIGLRANHRRDDVYLYPIRATPEALRQMFVAMVERANELSEKPEFYNTFTNTCTTNLVRHVNAIVPGRIPRSPAVLFPGYSDRFAYDLGLIDTDLPYDQIRDRFRINERALQYAADPEFSLRIR